VRAVPAGSALVVVASLESLAASSSAGSLPDLAEPVVLRLPLSALQAPPATAALRGFAFADDAALAARIRAELVAEFEPVDQESAPHAEPVSEDLRR
jgi:hypothetical protein